MRKLVSLLAVIVLALAAVSCGASGGSDSADDSDDTTTTAADETTTTADEGDDSTTTTPDDVSDVTEDDYIAAFAEQLSGGSEDGGDFVVPEETATCVAPLWVAAVTVESLHEAGVTVEEASDPSFDSDGLGLTDTEGQMMVDAFETCDFDVLAYFAGAMADGMTDEEAACVNEKIDLTLAEAFLVKVFGTGESDPEFEAVIDQLTKACDLPPA